MLDNYRRILSQNLWKTDRTFLAENLADWLLTTDSLTAKLEKHCMMLSVSLIQECWTEQGEWLREVILRGDGQSWVFAQTHFSAALMAIYGDEISQLAETPLGYWLFSKQPQRQAIQWLQDPQTGLYARRSLFQISGADLTVTELFLDDFRFPMEK